MLKDSFYKAGQIDTLEEGKFTRTIHLDANHAIFGGHFPEIKVVPGVTMVQIVKETCEEILGISLRMQHSKMIKFLSMIRPEENVDLDVAVTIANEASPWEVSGQLQAGDIIFFKIKGTFHAAG